MQTIVLPKPLQCTDFVKARERLLQIALRHIPREYNERCKLERTVRQAVECVFRDANGWFTYANVLKTKHFIGFVDRKLDRNQTAESMTVSVETYAYVTGTDIYRLPLIRRYARNHLLRLMLREPLGTIALAWQVICNNTLVLTREKLLLL